MRRSACRALSPAIGIVLIAPADFHGSLLEMLDALSPEGLADTELWTLMGGQRSQRQSLARILQRRKIDEETGMMIALKHDRDVMVRGTAAQCLAAWAGEGYTYPSSVRATETLATEPGTQVALGITYGVAAYPDTAIAIAIATTLVEHPSSRVRRWARSVLEPDPTGPS
ncbi:hypothetical protein ACFWUP_02905 [Nocardia sp. NPDC058658]|uniref:hypothetical protein n=1 Tax=Nocardia sp. NPDC058658 TaxID=3346580 RepID=UPI003664F6EA